MLPSRTRTRWLHTCGCERASYSCGSSGGVRARLLTDSSPVSSSCESSSESSPSESSSAASPVEDTGVNFPTTLHPAQQAHRAAKARVPEGHCIAAACQGTAHAVSFEYQYRSVVKQARSFKSSEASTLRYRVKQARSFEYQYPSLVKVIQSSQSGAPVERQQRRQTLGTPHYSKCATHAEFTEVDS